MLDHEHHSSTWGEKVPTPPGTFKRDESLTYFTYDEEGRFEWDNETHLLISFLPNSKIELPAHPEPAPEWRGVDRS
jgi:hypothetical protein